jgi:mercuric ion transport protein
MIRRVAGVLLMITGILACPCHLVITLPLLASLLAGTALGVVLQQQRPLIVALATLSFVGALALGGWLLWGAERRGHASVVSTSASCPTCRPRIGELQRQEPVPATESRTLALSLKERNHSSNADRHGA